MRAEQVTAKAPGKVNLALHVGPPGGDGYHPLATVFQAVDLWEQVTVTALPRGSGIVITVSGPGAAQVPLDHTNLAYRAAQALADRVGVLPDVALHLEKGVPVAGGMAGGSADAAATLVACNSLWQAHLPLTELLEIGAELGSDVPFSILGGTAIGTGHGHLLTPISNSQKFYWAFAIQKKGLSTPKVFQKFDELSRRDSATALKLAQNDGEVERHSARSCVAAKSQNLESAINDSRIVIAIQQHDAAELGKKLVNDLQSAALELRPELAHTIEVAIGAGALNAIVSGSGPTVAALAASEQHAQKIAAAWLETHTAGMAVTAASSGKGAYLIS